MTQTPRKQAAQIPMPKTSGHHPQAPATTPVGERVFKSDRRSRVWLVDRPQTAGGPVVYKRFEYAPWRQALAALLKNHPAQNELIQNQALRAVGLPVVPIIDHGIDRVRTGRKFWLCTPYRGENLRQYIHNNRVTTRQQRLRVIRFLAHMTADLIQRGYFFRDLKPSNIIVDETGRTWLIDVGSARPSRQPEHAIRMLRHLAKETAKEGVSRTDQWRFLHDVVNRCGQWGTLREVVAMVGDTKE
jgi:serine/threonine protein kinase